MFLLLLAICEPGEVISNAKDNFASRVAVVISLMPAQFQVNLRSKCSFLGMVSTHTQHSVCVCVCVCVRARARACACVHVW